MSFSLSDLGMLISKSAPVLGSVVGTINPLAGMAINAVMALFGVKTNDPQELANAIQADPDHDIKLKQLEYQHQEALLDAQVKIRLGAYDRETTYIKNGRRDWVMDFLAVFVTISFVSLCYTVAFVNIEPSHKDLFYMLLGTFSAAWGGIIAYFFGGNPTPQPFIQKPSKSEVVLPPPAQTR